MVLQAFSTYIIDLITIMKRLFILILSVLILSACNSDVKKILKLEQELKKAHSKQEEKRILSELWSIAYNSPEINMSVNVTDAKGRNVTNDLQLAVEPVNVTLTMSMADWIKRIEFVPLDINNLYILFKE
jgi:hypothetical protein